MRDAQDNDMFYYFRVDSLMNNFCMMVLLYADVYTITNVPVASALLKQKNCPHQGGQPGIHHAHQGDVDRIEVKIVASQR